MFERQRKPTKIHSQDSQTSNQWSTRGGVSGVQTPPEIPKALQKIVPNSTRLWKLFKKIAEFRKPTRQDVRKKGSKILKLRKFAIVLH